ncbi:asparagine synthase-related protein [Streptomyces sp. NPDC051921]|uniref:asparagine synthase-related protein n=1 Tax=Streptomyces sp. NPDC051921 TaxID=3155806 RepID=UPI003441F3B0
MSRILGQFGTDIAPHLLRFAADRAEAGGRVLRGGGWALAGERASAAGGVAAVLTGRLDVRLPLLSRLEAAGHAVAEHDHAALVRAAHEADGPEFTERLRGGYAVAVADTRGVPLLVLATDDAGSVPLYYHWDPVRRIVRFATELPALIALLPDRPSLREPGFDAYLAVGATLDGATVLDGVRMLPPATTAVCERGRDLRLVRRTPAGTPKVPAPAPGRELLGERARRRGAGPAADALLGSPGGGAALLRELAGSDLPSVGPAADGNSGTSEPAAADRPAADRAPYGVPVRDAVGGAPDRPPGPRDRAGSDPLDRRAARDLPEVLPALAWRLGLPEADPGSLVAYAAYGTARRQGLGTVLASDAADVVVGGRRRVELAVGDSAQDWAARYVEALAPVPAAHRTRLYSRDYAAYLADRGDAAGGLAARLGTEADRRSRRAALTAFELDELLPARGLRRTAHLGAAHGVRGVLPWPTRRLWVAAEPYSTAHPTGPGPARALSGLLVPGGALMDFVRETLAPSRLRVSGLLSRRSVERLLAAQLARPSERLARTVWALVMFELWREEYGATVRRPVRPPVRAKSPADLPALTRRTVAL